MEGVSGESEGSWETAREPKVRRAGAWLVMSTQRRIQKLMGHATPAMSLRYAAHSPASYFTEDAARLAANIQGVDREAEARAKAAQSGLRTA